MESKFTGMRLGPEVLGKIERFQKGNLWTPGQVFAQLLDYQCRVSAFVDTVRVGYDANTGERLILMMDSSNPGEALGTVDGEGTQAMLCWLVEELKKPINLAFIEEPPAFEEIY